MAKYITEHTSEASITRKLPDNVEVFSSNNLLREPKSEKPDFTIIPYEAMEELAYQFMDGATKYERDNYKNATVDQIQTYRESAQRHMNQYIDGQKDEKHLRAVMCNAAIIMFLEKKHGVYE